MVRFPTGESCNEGVTVVAFCLAAKLDNTGTIYQRFYILLYTLSWDSYLDVDDVVVLMVAPCEARTNHAKRNLFRKADMMSPTSRFSFVCSCHLNDRVLPSPSLPLPPLPIYTQGYANPDILCNARHDPISL